MDEYPEYDFYNSGRHVMEKTGGERSGGLGKAYQEKDKVGQEQKYE